MEYEPPQEMKKVGLDMSRFQVAKSKITNERQELIEKFVIRLNNGRVAGGFKPLGAGFYATKMSHIKTDDLWAFYKKLDGSANFGGLWYYYCVPKSCKKKSGEK